MSDDAVTPRLPQPLPWWVMPCLGAMVLLLFGAGLIAAFAFGNETQQTTMLTATVTLATAVIAFYYGSSNGSQRKDDAIAARAQSGQPDQPMAIAISNPEPKP